MRFTVHFPAPKDSIYEQGAWDGSIDKVIPVTVGSGDVVLAPAKVIAARVVEDGSAVEITLEIEAEISTAFNPITYDVVEAKFVPVPKLPKRD